MLLCPFDHLSINLFHCDPFFWMFTLFLATIFWLEDYPIHVVTWRLTSYSWNYQQKQRRRKINYLRSSNFLPQDYTYPSPFLSELTVLHLSRWLRIKPVQMKYNSYCRFHLESSDDAVTEFVVFVYCLFYFYTVLVKLGSPRTDVFLWFCISG